MKRLILIFLITTFCYGSEFLRVVEDGNAKNLRDYISRNHFLTTFDINEKNIKGQNAFHLASMQGASDKLYELYQYGKTTHIEINEKDQGQMSPLFYAIKSECLKCVNYLDLLGANMNIRGPQNESAPMLAVKNGSTKILESLLRKGASANLIDAQSNSALIYAVKLNDIDAAQRLIAYEADYNYQNRDGETPLLIAAIYAMNEMYFFLKSLGNIEVLPEVEVQRGRNQLIVEFYNQIEMLIERSRDRYKFSLIKGDQLEVGNLYERLYIAGPLFYEIRQRNQTTIFNITKDEPLITMDKSNAYGYVTLTNKSGNSISLRFYTVERARQFISKIESLQQLISP